MECIIIYLHIVFSYGTGSEVVAEITQAQGKVGVAQLRGGVLVDTGVL